MKTELYYVIIDWAGNHLFLNKKFETYQDGWDFIYENVDNSLYDKTQDNNDDNYQEYYVVLNKHL